MAAIEHPAVRRSRVGFWWFALSAIAIAVVAPLPYLVGSLQTLAENEGEIATNYVGRPQWAQSVFYVHIVFAGVALLLSPVQFIARLRDRHPKVHRVNGRIVLTSIALGGIAGLVLAPMSVADLVGTLGFGALAILWLTCATLAYRAIRRRDVTTHRHWMIRTFSLTYAAVTLRLWLGILIAGQIFAGVDAAVAFDRAYHIVPFLAWVPNVIIAELVIRKERR